ncbi:MAG: glycosyltransferase [Limosilactobacillus oris]|jgi:glycosyltransferase EpsF|uniref:glycosyltransferase n=1 Tax=Megasphaera sp. TaxID=2023260 RepID=UPI0025BE5C40|nr:glycosyltransferase [Megasphaera sp.]MCH3903155.1 glycosyltransferase [Limosilactobacillus oris]MCH3931781.1 glycosyltransferase [Megasphaera sp.]
MKILMYGLTSSLGGVERYILDRLPAFCKRNQVDILFSGNDKIGYIDEIPNDVNIKRIAKLSCPTQYVQNIYTTIKDGKYNLVYCNIGFANALLYLAVRAAGAKLIVHAHNTRIDVPSKKARILLNAYHYISRFLFTWLIDKKFGCGKAACKWLFGSLNGTKIRHNAIDCSKFSFNEKIRQQLRGELGVDNKTILVGHVGRFSYQKNHEYLIRLFANMHEKYSDTKLLLIGVGENMDYIRNLVKALSIESDVIFLGLRHDVNRIMQAIDCFILPSRFEGLPVVGIEAQAADLPCFFSDSITKEIAITKKTYFFSLQDELDNVAQFIYQNIDTSTRHNNTTDMRLAGYDLLDELKQF